MQLCYLLQSCLILCRQKPWIISKTNEKGHLDPNWSRSARTVDLLFFMIIPVTYANCIHTWSQLVSFFPPLQIEVVNTFKSGTSFQGALRRQSSVTSQTQDVTNISSPSHVSLSNALSSPTSTSAAAAGRECEFLLHPTLRDANLARVPSDSAVPSPGSAPTWISWQNPMTWLLCVQ